MSKLDWDKLRTFYTVAEAGSIARASRELNVSQPALSRQVALLEESLMVKLFNRHARGVLLTEQGEALYRTVKEIYRKLEMVEATLGENREKPSGLLTITTAVGFGVAWLTQRVVEFQKRYPDIRVNLVVDDRAFDLAMREADVAIRMVPATHSSLVQRPLMEFRYPAYASPQYLQARGAPMVPEDLDEHSLIGLQSGVDRYPYSEINWLLKTGRRSGEPREPVLNTTNLYSVYTAVKGGLGIGPLPDFMEKQIGESRLIRVLPNHETTVFKAYFVYPGELRRSKRVTVFRDFLFDELAGSAAPD